MNELKYFFSTRTDGNMDLNPRFYHKGMTEEQIKRSFDFRRMDLGIKYGFNGLRIVVPTMKLENNGKSIQITRELLEDYKDLFDFHIEADILTMNSKLYGTVLACPVADYPVVFAYDNDVNAVGMAYCSEKQIDKNLPRQLVDAMRETFDSKVMNLSVYIGPFIHVENYKYNRYPKWLKKQNWNKCIIEEEDGYHVDLETAIIKQLVSKGIDRDSIYASAFDTATNDLFYSDIASRENASKAGRFYEGCYFSTDVRNKVKIK